MSIGATFFRFFPAEGFNVESIFDLSVWVLDVPAFYCVYCDCYPGSSEPSVLILYSYLDNRLLVALDDALDLVS